MHRISTGAEGGEGLGSEYLGTFSIPAPLIASRDYQALWQPRASPQVCKSLHVEKSWTTYTMAQNSGPHVYQHHLEDLLKRRLLSPASRVSHSVGLGWDPRIWISNKFLGDADNVGASLWEPLTLKQKPAGQESKEKGLGWVQ